MSIGFALALAIASAGSAQNRSSFVDGEGRFAIRPAVELYRPYMQCVTGRALLYSKGPDSAEAVAIAAMDYCGELAADADVELVAAVKAFNESASRDNVMSPERTKSFMDRAREHARTAAISATVESRADVD